MTKERALRQIFSNNKLDDYMRHHKTLFKQGKLSENVAKKILENAGYIQKKESTWTKPK
jgi:hypothetical protein